MLIQENYTVRNFCCFSVYKRPDDGLQLKPKHVVMNKLIKSSVVYD
jgi:hypothetical protein